MRSRRNLPSSGYDGALFSLDDDLDHGGANALGEGDDRFIGVLNAAAFCGGTFESTLDTPQRHQTANSSATLGRGVQPNMESDADRGYRSLLKDCMGLGGRAFHYAAHAPPQAQRSPNCALPIHHDPNLRHRGTTPPIHFGGGGSPAVDCTLSPPPHFYSAKGTPSSTAGGTALSSGLDTTVNEDSPGRSIWGGRGGDGSRFSTPTKTSSPTNSQRLASHQGAVNNTAGCSPWKSPFGSGSPDPSLHHPSPFGTPSRYGGNSPNVYQHLTPSKHLRTPVRVHENSLGGASMMSGEAGSFDPTSALFASPSRLPVSIGHNGNSPSHSSRRREVLTAFKVLDGQGIATDLISKVLAYGSACNLLVALKDTVYQWSPSGITTVLEAASNVSAVAATSRVNSTYHFAAVGLTNGLIHVFEFDAEGNVIASFIFSECQSRVTCLSFFEGTLYCGIEDGLVIVLDVRRPQLRQQYPTSTPPLINVDEEDGHEIAARLQFDDEERAPLQRETTRNVTPEQSNEMFADEPSAVSAPWVVLYRCDLGHMIHVLEVTENGNHVAVGHARGITIFHRTQMHPTTLVETSRPVRTLSWAPPGVGLGVLLYATGERDTVLVMHSVSGGIRTQKETFFEILNLKCSKRSEEVFVAHGRCRCTPGLEHLAMHHASSAHHQIESLLEPDLSPPPPAVAAGNTPTAVDPCGTLIYDISGGRIRQCSRLSGQTSFVLHMTLSPDGNTLVTATTDENIRFWDVSPTTGGFLWGRQQQGGGRSGGAFSNRRDSSGASGGGSFAGDASAVRCLPPLSFGDENGLR